MNDFESLLNNQDLSFITSIDEKGNTLLNRGSVKGFQIPHQNVGQSSINEALEQKEEEIQSLRNKLEIVQMEATFKDSQFEQLKEENEQLGEKAKKWRTNLDQEIEKNSKTVQNLTQQVKDLQEKNENQTLNKFKVYYPIPPYDGPWTMEDIKKLYGEMRAPWDHTSQSTDIDEMMRRVPGLTRREALRIQQLGLTPHEEVDYAYLVVNLGIDVFYEANQAYVLRQVVTNSKGEKVEVLWPSSTYDEMTMMSYGNAPIWEMHENPWDPIPGELPIRVHPDYDLGVPYTWFEYEMDSRIHYLMTEDQMFIPEDARPFPAVKNPNAHSYIWKSQENLIEEDEMRDPNWYPKDTYYNIYNKPDHERNETGKTLREHNLGW